MEVQLEDEAVQNTLLCRADTVERCEEDVYLRKEWLFGEKNDKS